MTAARVAVVGHVEWVAFARVERVPLAGEIAHATETWEEPAGGGGVASVQLARLAADGGECVLLTALGDDEVGHRAADGLTRLGVRVEAVFRAGLPQRRAFTFVDGDGERTITTLGPRLGPAGEDPLPWDLLREASAVYFCAGDAGALGQARAAGALVATAREGALLSEAGVRLDAVVGSASDGSERLPPGGLDPPPGLVVATNGVHGGTWRGADGRTGTFRAAPVPPPAPGVPPDAYGCGDSFAAGLAFGLGAGLDAAAALDLAARCGAVCRSGRGPYGRQLTRVGAGLA